VKDITFSPRDARAFRRAEMSVSPTSRHFSQELACSDVARALVPAASALLPTLPSAQCHSRTHVSR
jgi:hypothetical protein